LFGLIPSIFIVSFLLEAFMTLISLAALAFFFFYALSRKKKGL
jgi:hypothetical protein